MLLLKLFLVPLFLLLLSLAGKRWGPAVAGWLAGLPVVAGPILFFLCVERGVVFASNSAVAALSAVVASVVFSIAYSHAAQRLSWQWSLLIALVSWSGAALCLFILPNSLPLSLTLAVFIVIAAPRCFPCVQIQLNDRRVSVFELCCRMFAGAILTLVVTLVAGSVGARWSGLLAVFPVLGIVLAVFSHRSQGAAFSVALLRGMATGLYSFIAFCSILSEGLLYADVPVAFALAVFGSVMVQFISKRYLTY